PAITVAAKDAPMTFKTSLLFILLARLFAMIAVLPRIFVVNNSENPPKNSVFHARTSVQAYILTVIRQKGN
ncbi:MAG: hypothetical protein QM324_07280, partial [Bacteroidota bacterium]|nr:hypothetical protein [Bacteroidota bacterium]